MKRGLFITFEGPEGSGKSTHSKLLCDFLKARGLKVLHTREPGGTTVSEKIRKILLDPRNKDMDTVCEMLLYMAARDQVLKEKILPALRKGHIVICDRFLDASVVYQGYAGGISPDIIKDIGLFITRGLSPDVTFLLDIDVRKGLARLGKTKDRMERKSLFFHKKVREGYLVIARKEAKRVRVISAVEDIAETQEGIRKAVLRILNARHQITNTPQ